MTDKGGTRDEETIASHKCRTIRHLTRRHNEHTQLSRNQKMHNKTVFGEQNLNLVMWLPYSAAGTLRPSPPLYMQSSQYYVSMERFLVPLKAVASSPPAETVPANCDRCGAGCRGSSLWLAVATLFFAEKFWPPNFRRGFPRAAL